MFLQLSETTITQMDSLLLNRQHESNAVIQPTIFSKLTPKPARCFHRPLQSDPWLTTSIVSVVLSRKRFAWVMLMWLWAWLDTGCLLIPWLAWFQPNGIFSLCFVICCQDIVLLHTYTILRPPEGDTISSYWLGPSLSPFDCLCIVFLQIKAIHYWRKM